MSKRLFCTTAVIIALTLSVPVCSAAIGPVTRITTDNPPGSPPYNILSITVGSYTVTADRLATGTTTHGGIGGTPCPEMDDWDINTALDWNLGGGNFWTINFGGGPWKNSNGDDPDFFLFEYGGTETPDVAAVLPGGSLGRSIRIPDQWANLGYSRVAAASGDPVSGSGNGQSLEGMSWAITDLLDAAGNPLTNSSVIEGIAIVNRNGIDPIGFFAVVSRAVQAKDPDPGNEATDVGRDAVLSWTPGQAANAHDVYFGTVFADVNDASRTSPRGVLAIRGQVANSYDPPGRLEFETTYYWRIDEVEAPPASTVHRGNVWSFTTEPVGYPIDGTSITATASSMVSADYGPENTIDGSGLDVSDLHSTEATDMWLSGSEPLGAWIQYRFDEVYKLHEMWIWNSNQTSEGLFGFGFKDVVVEYSANGTDWTALANVPQFAKAPGANGYAHNTTVDFGGTVAQYVRLTATSNWGGLYPQYSLSEVRFFYIPMNARMPSPDSGATDVDVNATLSWRAGREVAKHNVHLSTDEQAVIAGTAAAVSVTNPNYSVALDLSSTYYWRVDEVNDADTPSTWQGDVWSFSTSEYLVVDDFESYNNIDPPDPESNRIFESWSDGFGVAANGALVGNDFPPYLEQTIVHGGAQSLPLFYSNTSGATYSEAKRTFATSQDWTKHGIVTLVLYFYGTPGNTGQLYVKVNDAKVTYPGDAADIARPRWKQWNIDLAALGIALQNVTTLAVGTDGNGASGTLYVDDIVLYRFAPPVALEETWLEAEAATILGPSWRMDTSPEASGGWYIGSRDGDGDDNTNPPAAPWIASYNFTVTGGVYKVAARIITSPGNSFWVRIPGATSPQITRADGWVNTNPMDAGATWHWDEFHNDDQNDNVVYFTLSAGQHRLEIAKREDGTLLDAMVIMGVK